MTKTDVVEDVPVGGSEGRFKLGDFAVDEYRPIRVIVIGAGFSGILAGIRYVFPSCTVVSPIR